MPEAEICDCIPTIFPNPKYGSTTGQAYIDSVWKYYEVWVFMGMNQTHRNIYPSAQTKEFPALFISMFLIFHLHRVVLVGYLISNPLSTFLLIFALKTFLYTANDFTDFTSHKTFMSFQNFRQQLTPTLQS